MAAPDAAGCMWMMSVPMRHVDGDRHAEPGGCREETLARYGGDCAARNRPTDWPRPSPRATPSLIA